MDITYEDGRKSQLTSTHARPRRRPRRRPPGRWRRERGDGPMSDCANLPSLQLSSRGRCRGIRAAHGSQHRVPAGMPTSGVCRALDPSGAKLRDDTVARRRSALMWDELQFGISLAVSGLSIGLMYSLIALGFVLVYKATDAINFAQGEFVMLAGFVAAVALAVKGMPVIGAVRCGGGGHDRVQLRARARRAAAPARPARRRRHHGHHRPRRHPARAAADHGRRRDARAVAAASATRRSSFGPALAAADPGAGRRRHACCSWRLFTWFFLKSRMGVAMRAVADNQQVAMAMGINVERYFALAWAMAGMVSALGGVIWGSMLGVDVHLALVGLKVFPVVILGGLDFDPRRGGRRADRRPGREPGRRLPRPLRRRRHQGLRALRADDHRLDVQALRHFRHAQDRAGVDGSHAASRVRSLQDQLRRRHGALPAADRALDGGGGHRAVRGRAAPVAARVLPLHHQSVADRRRRRARPQHPGRLHRPDLGRPRGLHVGRRLHGRQPRRAARTCRSG